VSQAARSCSGTAGRRFSEAGSQLPFPLRSDLGDLADRHGAGVAARGPTYVPRETSRRCRGYPDT
jgi:hypothetical protein